MKRQVIFGLFTSPLVAALRLHFVHDKRESPVYADTMQCFFFSFSAARSDGKRRRCIIRRPYYLR